MTNSYHPDSARVPGDETDVEADEQPNDAGVTLTLTALIILPLMLIAGFAVDLGGWYVTASQAQSASDAAALAGVIWMPNEVKAREAALELAEQNGFVDGVNATIVTTPHGANRFEVKIETPGEMVFSSLALDPITIARGAIAEYSPPLNMGSPTNVLGLGTYTVGGETPSNAWSGMMGFCVNPTWGDLRSFRTTDSKCGAVPSPWHDPGGYLWIIDVPAGSVNPVTVNIFDPGYCTPANRATHHNEGGPPKEQGNIHYRFTLYEPDNTPYDNTDNTEYGAPYQPATAESCEAFTPAFTLPAGTTGRWVLRSQIQNNNSTNGQNYFSLWADTNAHTGQCSTITDPTCVGIYAADFMPVRTASFDDPAIFYLAEVDPVYQNNKLEISSWDLGEGMESVQILDPAGNEMPFTYETDDGVHSGSSEPCNDGNECLWVTNKIFNGRLVRMTIDLSGLPWGSFPDEWFQVQYNKTAADDSYDWTTWGVRVLGDPIRLVD
ncbi:MAG: hypothetical protein GY698_14010 [Actinomycetia bacterium]|nr:hypothetical protein [Actinomycetes bacterium]